MPLDSEDLIVVDSEQKLNYATKILADRIMRTHVSNGVSIMGDCTIEAEVEIGKGSMIFAGNILKGNTKIGENSILKENNIIENSYIGNDVCVSSSNVVNSKIEDNAFVLPYCYINNATIRKNCYIGSHLSIENRTVRAGSRLTKEN